MSDLVGQTLEHYQIEALLGIGGMGAVYRATDLRLKRQVAVKVMHDHLAARGPFQERFMGEAQAAAALDHPGIVKILHFTKAHGQLLLVMDYVGGGSLRDYLGRLHKAQKYLDLDQAVELVRQVAQALDYAHQQGMVHRDVKPDNVLLKAETDGTATGTFRAVLTDFGLVKLMESVGMTVSGQPLGTYPYMSPEQCRGEADIDARTDIYALGIMLYELTVGRLPYEPRSITEAMRMHTEDPLPPPDAYRPDYPAELAAVVAKCLAKERGARFQRAGDLARALRELQTALASGQVTALPTIPDQTDSLLTYLMSQPQLPPQRQQTPPSVATHVRQQDRLVIQREGETPYVVPLEGDVITIGRDEQQNEIALPSQKVSRQHARLERMEDGGYRITDLSSANGTWLGGARLLSHMPEAWAFGQGVSVGDFWLRLEQGAGGGDTSEMMSASARRFTLSYAPGVTELQSQTGQIGVAVAPSAVQVEPGRRAEVQVEVLNQSDVVGHYVVTTRGLPAEWVTVPKEPVRLMPGERGTVTVSLHPPWSGKSRAGQYRFALLVSNQDTPGDRVEAPLMMEVGAFHAFQVELRPERVTNAGKLALTVHNQGNTVETYQVRLRDLEASLRFAGMQPQTQLKVEPGQALHSPLAVRARQRPLLGMTQHRPFEVTVSEAGERQSVGQQQVRGMVVVRPLLPRWLLGLASMALILCLALGAFAVSQYNANNATLTAVAQAHGTETAGAMTQAVQAIATQTADARTLAAEARELTQTAEARTAQAQERQTQTAEAHTLAAESRFLTQTAESRALTQTAAANLALAQERQTQAAQALTQTAEVLHATWTAEARTAQAQERQTAEAYTLTARARLTDEAFTILDVSASVSPGSSTTCPTTFNYSGTITASGAGTVTYRWERSDGATGPNNTVTFTGSGSRTVTTEWTLSAEGTRWERVHILSPVDVYSNQASFTLTCAPAGPSAVYIYEDDSGTAQSYRSLLENNDMAVTLLHINSVTGTQLAGFDIVLIGPDTGNNYDWGTSAAVNHILSGGQPVIGLGGGGGSFFQQIDWIYVNWGHGAWGNYTNFVPLRSSDRLWSTPNRVSLSSPLSVYSSSSSCLVLYTGYIEFIDDHTFRRDDTVYNHSIEILAVTASDASYAPLVIEADRFMQWGFESAPDQMTTAGQQLFINAIYRLID